MRAIQSEAWQPRCSAYGAKRIGSRRLCARSYTVIRSDTNQVWCWYGCVCVWMVVVWSSYGLCRFLLYVLCMLFVGCLYG